MTPDARRSGQRCLVDAWDVGHPDRGTGLSYLREIAHTARLASALRKHE